MLPVVRTVLVALAVATVPAGATMRDVVLVANSEGGTVDLIDATTLTVVKTLDVTPPDEEPFFERDPVQAAVHPLVVRAGGDNFAQDLDLSPDGTVLYVSRGHLADVAAFDLATGALLWRVPVSGFRADHMAIHPDGSRLYVSAITENVVEVIDTATAAVIGSFPTGEWPHGLEFSPDGSRIYNGSIGNVLLPEEARFGRPAAVNAAVGESHLLTIADPASLAVLETHAFEAGIRPFVITGDEKRLYAQLSFFHGVVEYDLDENRVVRTLALPVKEGVTEDDYDFEAPHHGIALSPDESLLCIAGRASDYAALVSTETMLPVAILDVPDGPGWSVTSPDGTRCFVASARADRVTVIDYETRTLEAEIAVGHHPHHLLAGRVPQSVLTPAE